MSVNVNFMEDNFETPEFKKGTKKIINFPDKSIVINYFEDSPFLLAGFLTAGLMTLAESNMIFSFDETYPRCFFSFESSNPDEHVQKLKLKASHNNWRIIRLINHKNGNYRIEAYDIHPIPVIEKEKEKETPVIKIIDEIKIDIGEIGNIADREIYYDFEESGDIKISRTLEHTNVTKKLDQKLVVEKILVLISRLARWGYKFSEIPLDRVINFDIFLNEKIQYLYWAINEGMFPYPEPIGIISGSAPVTRVKNHFTFVSLKSLKVLTEYILDKANQESIAAKLPPINNKYIGMDLESKWNKSDWKIPYRYSLKNQIY